MSRHLKDESPVSCVLTFTVNWGLCTFGYYQRRIFRKYPLPTIVARREQVLHWHRQVRWACWQQRDGQDLQWSSMWSGFRYRDRRRLLSLATPGEDRHCHHHCHHMRPHGHNRHREIDLCPAEKYDDGIHPFPVRGLCADEIFANCPHHLSWLTFSSFALPCQISRFVKIYMILLSSFLRAFTAVFGPHDLLIICW